MVKVHIPRALSVNSLKLEPGGGPGGAGGRHTEAMTEAEVKLVESFLIQDAEVKKSRSEAARCIKVHLYCQPYFFSTLDRPIGRAGQTILIIFS